MGTSLGLRTKAASFRRRKLAAEITFMCYNMDAKNITGSSVFAVEPCSFIHRSNRLGSALQFFPYTGRRKALTCLPKAEKHIEVIVVFNEWVLHKIVFCSVRGEVFKTTEVQNPVQNRLMNPKPDTSSEFSPLREAKNGENRPEKLQLLQKFRKLRCR